MSVPQPLLHHCGGMLDAPGRPVCHTSAVDASLPRFLELTQQPWPYLGRFSSTVEAFQSQPTHLLTYGRGAQALRGTLRGVEGDTARLVEPPRGTAAYAARLSTLEPVFRGLDYSFGMDLAGNRSCVDSPKEQHHEVGLHEQAQRVEREGSVICSVGLLSVV